MWTGQAVQGKIDYLNKFYVNDYYFTARFTLNDGGKYEAKQDNKYHIHSTKYKIRYLRESH